MTRFDWLRGPALYRGRISADVAIEVAGEKLGRVLDIAAGEGPVPEGGRTLFCPESVIAPGFIDVHVHGGGGADFMDPDADAIARIIETHAAHGTTALLATTLSAPEEELLETLQRLASFRRDHPRGRRILGYHVEGPFLNPYAAGAQEVRFLRRPSEDEIDQWWSAGGNGVWLVTLAPEIEGATKAIERLRDRMASVAFGHTRASYAEVVQAVSSGARHATHLFNAMSPLHHREPGAVGAALTLPGVTVELIADGVHVHPAALALACRARAEDEVLLVTDATRLAGASEAASGQLLDRPMTLRDGAPRLPDGTLAGSVLTLDRAVANMVKLAGISRERALRMASEYSARFLGLADRKGHLARGFDADLVVLDPEGNVEMTIVAGEVVFER